MLRPNTSCLVHNQCVSIGLWRSLSGDVNVLYIKSFDLKTCLGRPDEDRHLSWFRSIVSRRVPLVKRPRPCRIRCLRRRNYTFEDNSVVLQHMYMYTPASTCIPIGKGLGLSSGLLVEAFLSRLTPLGLTWFVHLHNTFCTHVSDRCCSSLVVQCLGLQTSRHICHTTPCLLIEYIASWHQPGPRSSATRKRGLSQVAGRAEVSGIGPQLCTIQSPDTMCRETPQSKPTFQICALKGICADNVV